MLVPSEIASKFVENVKSSRFIQIASEVARVGSLFASGSMGTNLENGPDVTTCRLSLTSTHGRSLSLSRHHMADLSLSVSHTHVTTWQISLSDVTTWRISLSLTHTSPHGRSLSLTHTRHHMADLSLSDVTTWRSLWCLLSFQCKFSHFGTNKIKLVHL